MRSNGKFRLPRNEQNLEVLPKAFQMIKTFYRPLMLVM